MILNLKETPRIIHYHHNLILQCTNYTPLRGHNNLSRKAMRIEIYQIIAIRIRGIGLLKINNSYKKAFLTMCKEGKKN
jgi:hypothetical protein